MLFVMALGASTASASDLDPFMWGIGGKLGTVIVPGQFPFQFPTAINKYDFIEEGPRAGADDGENKDRDLDANGDPIFSTLRRVKGDFRFAAEGFYGIDGSNRVGATLGLNSGKGFSEPYFTLNYDNVLVKEPPFNVVAGLGVGYGQMTFKGVDDEETPKLGPGLDVANEILKVPNFPIRGRVAGQFRGDSWMAGLGAFVGTNIPSNMYYTDLSGTEQEKVGSLTSLTYFLNGGIELTVMYGDFTPPKPKPKPGKGKGAKGGKGKKGGGGGGGGGGGSPDVRR